MIQYFTSQEKTVIIILSSLLGIGYMIQSVKDYYYEEKNHLTHLGTYEEVADNYSQLNHDAIQFSGIVDINTAGIDELMTFPGIGQKTAEKIIVKLKELGQYNSLQDIMLVPGIGAKIYKNISSQIRINKLD